MQQSPPLDTSTPNAQFRDVSCPARTTCVAVGSYVGTDGVGRTLAERWDGGSWRVAGSPNAANSEVSSLDEVSCVSAAACEAVGSWHGIRSTPAALLAASWNGRSWRMVPIPELSSTSLGAISCAAAGACMTVGSRTTPSGGSQAVAQTWNGRRWRIAAARNPAAFTQLSGVSCPGPRDCTAVGSYSATRTSPSHPLVERWDGTRWRVAAVPSPPAAHLSSVSCPTATTCTAVGGYQPAGRDARMLVEVRQGHRWTSPPSPATGALSSVSCTSASFCLALGSASGAERWDGHRWSEVSAPDPYNPSQRTGLASVSCISATSCVAVGATGPGTAAHTLVASWDGSGWKTVSSPNPAGSLSSTLTTVSCSAATWCTAVGYYFPAGSQHNFTDALIESWNGTSWTLASSRPRVPFPAQISVSCASASACMAIWSSQGGLPTAEWWNGTRWAATTVAGPTPRTDETELAGVSCTSAKACTAAGSFVYLPASGPLVENWNGTHWTVTPSPNPRVGIGGFDAVSCTSATICTAVGTDARVLNVPFVEVRG